ncbi:hypothetical protein N183_30705 [Sinorhizobium sp. Sb3]|nr:hypothetical protein N183_30705 [Sinorhizobium sp. Sb3]
MAPQLDGTSSLVVAQEVWARVGVDERVLVGAFGEGHFVFDLLRPSELVGRDGIGRAFEFLRGLSVTSGKTRRRNEKRTPAVGMMLVLLFE